MKRYVLAFGLVVFPAVAASAPGTIVVEPGDKLEDVLVPANAGRRILVRKGTYPVTRPLVVPDGVTLEGEGVMTYGADGLPAGFAPGTQTLLVDALGLGVSADILTLGDGVKLARLAVESEVEVATPGVPFFVPSLIQVPSRGVGDAVTASIDECELFNRNGGGIEPRGPTGRALNIVTLNTASGPHEGASISVSMSRSIIRSPRNIYGIGAINFAPNAHVELRLEENVVGGGLNATAGVSRPAQVTGSTVTVHSSDNFYGSRAPDPLTNFGFRLHGGSSPPVGFPTPIPATTDNALRLHSMRDRIEGAFIGVYASSGARNLVPPAAATSDRNQVDLQLLGTSIRAVLADFWLLGAEATQPGVYPGEENHLRVLMRGVTGSCYGVTGTCQRTQRYFDAVGPTGVLPAGSNRLEIVGSPDSFADENQGIVPPPGANFFTND